MSARRYERVSTRDQDDHGGDSSPVSPSPSARRQQQQQSHSPRQPRHAIPNSPPPSFRSQSSSPTRHSDREQLISDTDRTLADTFDAPSDDDSDDDDTRGLDERQRVMSGRPQEPEAEASTAGQQGGGGRPAVERRVTQLPVFAPAAPGRRTYGAGNASDGVFANLSAKPERGEEADEKPPTYEQAAADATPPYWETTILAPGGSSGDEVFIDGLPVGSLFSFIWNGMISMSFQLVGFLLTYLLHTTHAAKNGSKAGLGITLVQYGFTMKGNGSPRGHAGHAAPGADASGAAGGSDFAAPPADPNAHNFGPAGALGASVSAGASFVSSAVAAGGKHQGSHGGGGNGGGGGGGGSGFGSMTPTDWFAYALMIVGWFVLIRAISEYLKARRHETLVLQSPGRGLNQAVVADGEQPEASV